MRNATARPTISASDIPFIVREELGIIATKVVDKTKGCDHYVYLVTSDKQNIIVRVPVKDDEKLRIQAQACAEWARKGVLVPTPLIIRANYLIETCIPGIDLEDAKLSPKKEHAVYAQLGRILPKMHVVYRPYAGNIASRTGRYSRWETYCKTNFLDCVSAAQKNRNLSADLARHLRALYRQSLPHIKNVTRCSLLHGDLGRANIMVDGDELSGIIDAADAFAGDPLHDIGDLLCDNPDVTVLDVLETTYGRFNRQIVLFYAIMTRIWMPAHPNHPNKEKIVRKIEKLLKLGKSA